MDLRAEVAAWDRALHRSNKSAKTRVLYRRGMTLFEEYCALKGLPFTEKVLTVDVFDAFAIWLAEEYVSQRPITVGHGRDRHTEWVQKGSGRLTPTSLHHYLAVPPRFCRWLVKAHRDVLPFNPLQGIELPAEQPRERVPLTRQEFDVLLFHVGQRSKNRLRDSAILWTLLETGVRCKELVGIDAAGVDLDYGDKADLGEPMAQLRVHQKGGGERFTFVAGTAYDVLVRYMEAKPKQGGRRKSEPALFQTSVGDPMSDQTVRSLIDRVCAWADLRHLTPHFFRHTDAALREDHEQDIKGISRALGHRHVATTERYLHVNWRAVAKAHLKHSPSAQWGRRSGGSKSQRSGSRQLARTIQTADGFFERAFVSRGQLTKGRIGWTMACRGVAG